MMTYSLKDINNQVFPIGNRLQIGSDASNQVIIINPQVIPFHAILWEQDSTLYLQVNPGAQATYVNNIPVQGTVALQVGNQITVGDMTLKVEFYNPTFLNGNPVPVQPSVPLSISTPPSKKRAGCGRWIVIALIVFASECLLIAAAALILSSTDIEVRGGLQDLKAMLSSKSSDTAPTDTSQPGPAVLTLNDEWLKSNFTENFSQHQSKIAKGVSQTKTESTVIYQSEYMQQANPNWKDYSLVNQTANGVIQFQDESGTVNDIKYSNINNTCSSAPNEVAFYFSDQTPSVILTTDLAGHVKRVEEGVTLNGVLADRYELSAANFSNSETMLEFISGDLYRARNGGYLMQLDYVVKIQPQSWMINIGQDFSETDPTEITYHFDRIYVADGSQTYKVPDVCADQVQ
jgi:hypothetical protein